ncbi:MAG: nicotinate-nucleotide adenylyltransferase [Anaerolineae bacterium]|nr:nicotinate-nucleotide adenylyltransferase [Anaerolineae bacterium]
MSDNGLRIGIIGGTFDPIHIGHLIIADQVCMRLGLSRMVFVPAGLPPHKLDQPVTDPEQRLDMVKLAIADNPHFCVSRMDLDRFGPSYTVDTIRLFLDAWGANTEIYFLMGSDSLAELVTWRQPDRLMRLCRIVAVGRPGYEVDLKELDRLLPGAALLVRLIDMPTLDISSTDIKRYVGNNQSIRYMVPRVVETYIYDHGLYTPQAPARPME